MECQTILENNHENFTPNIVLLKEQKYKSQPWYITNITWQNYHGYRVLFIHFQGSEETRLVSVNCYMCTRTHACTDTHAQTHMHSCRHTCTDTHTHRHLSAHTDAYTNAQTHTDARAYTHRCTLRSKWGKSPTRNQSPIPFAFCKIRLTAFFSQLYRQKSDKNVSVLISVTQK